MVPAQLNIIPTVMQVSKAISGNLISKAYAILSNFTQIIRFLFILSDRTDYLEQGACRDLKGDKQMHGAFALDGALSMDECLALCKTKTYAKGCEYNKVNTGCWYHTHPVGSAGSPHGPNDCWIFNSSNVKAHDQGRLYVYGAQINTRTNASHPYLLINKKVALHP